MYKKINVAKLTDGRFVRDADDHTIYHIYLDRIMKRIKNIEI